MESFIFRKDLKKEFKKELDILRLYSKKESLRFRKAKINVLLLQKVKNIIRFSGKAIYPSNYYDQRRYFYESNFTKNPEFIYNLDKHEIENKLRELDKLRENFNPYYYEDYLLLKKLDEVEIKLKLKKSIGNNSHVNRFLSELYPYPSSDFIKYSLKKYQSSVKIDKDKNSEDFNRPSYLEKLIKDNHLNITFISMRLNDSRSFWMKGNHLYINTASVGFKALSKQQIDEIFLHEAMTHYLRKFNGNKFECELFNLGTANYLFTEEGLAIFNCYQKFKHIAPNYLLVYKALNELKNYSFCSLYNFFRKRMDSKMISPAFHLAARLKIGFTETTDNFLNTKYFTYIRGFVYVNEFLNYNPNMYKYLYLGKISIEDLFLLQNSFDKFDLKNIKLPDYERTID